MNQHYKLVIFTRLPDLIPIASKQRQTIASTSTLDLVAPLPWRLGPSPRSLLHEKQQNAVTIGYSTPLRFRKSFLGARQLFPQAIFLGVFSLGPFENSTTRHRPLRQ
jgi:hypothetical protein